ncbi:YrrS family protein [Pseudobacillus badius]|uniref:YrrS family protein n=1 Tax=Bacillus badius TaxID=1455 RepID=UPI0007B0877D|nr:YrrS family protein [Bacillus badius]KZN98753.1 hypothetical protein A4244_06485 [Bacillus badius]MED0666256.1 YrrS family protein [Bacillus badius]OCS83691.1 hypothetical protein A6M11_06490 [Bacillus badius]OVE53022.1 DUF1510 domain-containing protein [Bacillus badius]TDW05064.1 SpoIIIAH-like protein [Bacillus badius]
MAQSSRTERKSKRRKTNRILNTAIAVVVLLIVVVGFTIFSGGGKDEDPQPPKPKTETQQSAAKEKEEPSTDVKTSDVKEEDEDKADKEDQTDKEQKDKEQKDKGEVIEKESDEPNVEKEIIDPNWTGIGTSQSGQHTSSFDTGSVDWEEKKDALSYATGIPKEEMVVWYISGDGPKGAIGTVSKKSDQDNAYRVYINWVEGEGWKPQKMYKLEHNDKGR